MLIKFKCTNLKVKTWGLRRGLCFYCCHFFVKINCALSSMQLTLSAWLSFICVFCYDGYLCSCQPQAALMFSKQKAAVSGKGNGETLSCFTIFPAGFCEMGLKTINVVKY